MSNNPKLFMEILPLSTQQFVSVGNGDVSAISGIGTIHAIASFDAKLIPVGMNDTLFVPHLITNLLSVSKLRQAGFCNCFDTNNAGKGYCIVTRGGCDETIFKGIECQDGLPFLMGSKRKWLI